MMRSDFSLFDEYEYQRAGQPPFDFPITSFFATHDKKISQAMVCGWARFTTQVRPYLPPLVCRPCRVVLRHLCHPLAALPSLPLWHSLYMAACNLSTRRRSSATRSLATICTSWA